MTIDYAIKLLKDAKKDGVDHIIFAYWDASNFELKDNKDWAWIADRVEDDFDWSSTNEAIESFMGSFSEE